MSSFLMMILGTYSCSRRQERPREQLIQDEAPELCLPQCPSAAEGWQLPLLTPGMSRVTAPPPHRESCECQVLPELPEPSREAGKAGAAQETMANKGLPIQSCSHFSVKQPARNKGENTIPLPFLAMMACNLRGISSLQGLAPHFLPAPGSASQTPC